MKIKKHPALTALGEQIRTVRKDKGFSQEDFAAEAGLDRSYYGGVERGERNIAALNLMHIAAALQVEVGDLFPKAQVFESLLDHAMTEEE
jgi:transcriptional regulator with XRE-family HTH domain